MFTGIIEETGTVVEAAFSLQGGTLRISCPGLWKELVLGESVAVNGVCLTVTDTREGTFAADVSPESLQRSTLGGLRHGEVVNLERALRLDSRLGGHLVQGHVDGVGRIEEIREEGRGRTFFIGSPEDISVYLVEKGSVAVDGISLTVSGLRGTSFSVAVIPHTLAVTNLGRRRVGDAVNLEVDIIAKYVRSYLERGMSSPGEGDARSGGGDLYRKLV
ncbi:MAG: riboflavin synthase, partial [Actinomycetota bacterium]|nr:riboflavin synthase [Actinomycetota bacterium]